VVDLLATIVRLVLMSLPPQKKKKKTTYHNKKRKTPCYQGAHTLVNYDDERLGYSEAG
jgi:hypothetical protein